MQEYQEDDDAVMKRMAELELAAEDVEVQKQLLVDLDRRSNLLREGARALKDRESSSASDVVGIPPGRRPIWLLSSGGGVFLRTTEAEARVVMDEDAKKTRSDIEDARDELKRRVCLLAELEGPDSALHRLYQGFDLKPVNRQNSTS